MSTGLLTAAWFGGQRLYGERDSLLEMVARFPRPKAPAARKPLILPHEKDYAEFLAGLDLRHIAPYEILSAHRRERNGVCNVLPPRELWTGIIPTLEMADELRVRLGVPLRRINSAYRCPRYNSQCSGAAKGSYHTRNCALDLVYDCGPEAAMREAKKMRAEGRFRGGLGLYSSFIHLDTRGRNATWA